MYRGNSENGDEGKLTGKDDWEGGGGGGWGMRKGKKWRDNP